MASNQLETKPPPREAVEEWLNRVEDITASIQEILNEDPIEAAKKRKEREDQRRQMEINKSREKVRMRYDPRYYARFENDELIDKLLKEADNKRSGNRKSETDNSLYSRSERISLEEAIRLKEEAAMAVKNLQWEKANELYTSAILLNVVDTSLQRILRNNRALVQLKLNHYLEAIEDTSFVLQDEPTNVKALLRRATALRNLHRPIDALNDAELALQKEPESKEAANLIQWLQRVKKEHDSCLIFQHENPEEAKRLSESIKILISNVKNLQKVSKKNSQEESLDNITIDINNKEFDDIMKSITQSAENIRICLEIVQSFHHGAAVLFSIFNGIGPLIEIICILLSKYNLNIFNSTNPKNSGHISNSFVTFIVSSRLLSLVLLGSEAGADGLEISIVTRFLGSLTETLTEALEYKSVLNQNNTTTTVMIAILQVLEAFTMRFPSQVYNKCGSIILKYWNIIVQKNPIPQLLFFYCGILEGLLREPSISTTISKEIQGDMLLQTIKTTIKINSDQLKEIGLSLALRTSCVSSDWAKSMSSLEFTRLLAEVIPIYKEEEKMPLVSPRIEEGLYAVIYNVFLQVDSRKQYVEQWRSITENTNINDSSFTLRTWRLLKTRVNSNGNSMKNVIVFAKMMGVLSKFVSHDEILLKKMLEDEEILWSLLEIGISNFQLNNNNNNNEIILQMTAAWEVLDHVTTCLASFYSQNFLLREKGLIISNHISLILRIINHANDQHMIALGNAGLIASFVPPEGCIHFASFQAVDLILEKLRNMRELLFTLEHEGKKGTGQWNYARTTQKNLAIALSKCCVVESQRERLRELKGFETLHAILEQPL